MSLRRIFILLVKEFIQGPKNIILIFALVVPVVLSLVISLVFGTYFSGRSRLGLVDQGVSQLTELSLENQALIVRVYSSPAELEDAARRGAIDMGLVLPDGFDSLVQTGQLAEITAYLWGESLLRDRIVLASALMQSLRQISGHDSPVRIVEQVVGTGANIPWDQRLLPLLVLMSIIMAGVMVPSTSLVAEKMKRTLGALAVSPATLMEIFASKALLGIILSVFSGFLILFLNRSLGSRPAELMLVLFLGAVLSAELGVLLGSRVRDMSTLFATIKSIGIFLYAPGFVFMFPEIPQWIGRVFPTYYIIQPVMQITQEGAGLGEIALELAVLVGLIAASLGLVVWQSRRTQMTEALA
jgi:ABC-2 type transport system permease protein